MTTDESFLEEVHELESGEYVNVELNVSKGDRITGYIREKEGYYFEWYIVDEKNMLRYANDESFHPSRSGEEYSAYRVNWKVPKGGPWYLILAMYGKSRKRLIEVILRKKGIRSEVEEVKDEKEIRGEVYSCPVCGSIVQPDAMACPKCGAEFELG